MATFNTDISAGQAAAGGTSAALGGTNGNFTNRIDDSRRTEQSFEWLDTIYTIANPTTEANTDIINLGAIPPGSIIYPEHCFVLRETSPGTTLVIDVGDSVDPDRYADGMALGGSAGVVQFLNPVVNVAGVVTRHEVTDVTRFLIATIAGAPSALTPGAKIHFKIAYKALKP